jgi:transposase
MIAVSPHVRVLVAVEPVDFRRGIDGLAQICRQALEENPMDGAVFVFRNRRATSLKLLSYDGQGFWLAQKRLSAGRFKHWPNDPTQAARNLESSQLQVLLRGGDPDSVRTAPCWRPLRAVG